MSSVTVLPDFEAREGVPEAVQTPCSGEASHAQCKVDVEQSQQTCCRGHTRPPTTSMTVCLCNGHVKKGLPACQPSCRSAQLYYRTGRRFIQTASQLHALETKRQLGSAGTPVEWHATEQRAVAAVDWLLE